MTVKMYIERFKRSPFPIFFLLSLALFTAAMDLLVSPHNGMVGGDYSYFFPKILQGKLFFAEQGFRIPMYSPYDCGGTPFFANPQSMFYSVPQLLALYLDAWTAIRLTVAIFFMLQGIGAYLLLSKVFRCSPFAAAAGALVYSANTYYASRMMVGHLSYHSVGLLPFMLMLLLNQRIPTWLAATSLGSIAAYCFYAGAYSSIFLSVISIAIVTLLHLLGKKTTGEILISCRSITFRTATATLIALTLAAPKAYLALSYLKQFPHKFSLDQLASPIDLVTMIVSQLFLFGTFRPFPQYGLHEYNSTLSPVVLFGIWALIRNPSNNHLYRCHWAMIFLLSLLALFWLLLVSGAGAAAAILESAGLEALRLNIRFTGAMMLPLVVLAAKGLTKLNSRSEQLILCVSTTVSCAAILLLLGYPGIKPETHISAISELQSAEASLSSQPEIPNPREVVRDHYISASSALSSRVVNGICYEPLFFNETSPGDRLKDGPISDTFDGAYNMLNPSCLLFPELLNCSPGDRILSRDSGILEDLLRFRNPSIPVPKKLHVLVIMSVTGLVLCFGYLLFSAVSGLTSRRKSN